MVLGQEFRVFDWFIIHFTENNGMAFGLEFGGVSGKIILTLLRIVVVIIGLFYLSKTIKKHSSGSAYCYWPNNWRCYWKYN